MNLHFSLPATMVVLANTPNTIRSLLENLPEPVLTCNEGGDTFSAHDVVGHLIHGERADWMPRIETILSRSGATFVPFDRYAHREESKGISMDRLLDGFTRLRNDNLQRLHGMDLREEQLDLEGQHPELGRVTLRNLLAAWAVHDLAHIAQICRVLAKQYREATGPWIAYMNILNRPAPA